MVNFAHDYDKRDDFDFPMVNFPYPSSNTPESPANGVLFSQLICYLCLGFVRNMKIFCLEDILPDHASSVGGSFGAARRCSVCVLPSQCIWQVDPSKRMMTGGLVACDWLRPVTQGAWRVAPPISVVAHADVS